MTDADDPDMLALVPDTKGTLLAVTFAVDEDALLELPSVRKIGAVTIADVVLTEALPVGTMVVVTVTDAELADTLDAAAGTTGCAVAIVAEVVDTDALVAGTIRVAAVT